MSTSARPMGKWIFEVPSDEWLRQAVKAMGAIPSSILLAKRPTATPDRTIRDLEGSWLWA